MSSLGSHKLRCNDIHANKSRLFREIGCAHKHTSNQHVQVKVKVNQSTCIAPCMVQTTLKRSGVDHTAFNLQRTLCVSLPRKRSPDGASTECGREHLVAAHYLFIDPERMKG